MVGVDELLLATLVVASGGLIQGISGVGSGFIMVPLLAIIDFRFLPGALIFGSLSISGLMAWLDRQHIQFKDTPVVLIAIVPGALVGSWLLSIVATDQLGLFFGAMILLAVVITAFGVRLLPNLLNSTVAGLVAGAMGASSGIGAPIIALLYQHQAGPALRSTLAYLYTIASTLIVFALAVFGQFGLEQVALGCMLFPGFLLGLFLSRNFVLRVDQGLTRVLVLVVASISALSLIVSSLWVI